MLSPFPGDLSTATASSPAIGITGWPGPAQGTELPAPGDAAGIPGPPPDTLELPDTGVSSPGESPPATRDRHGNRRRGTGPSPDGADPAAPRARRRLIRILAITAGLVVIAAGGTAAAVVLLRHPAPRSDAARQPARTQAPAAPSPSATATPTPTPASSPTVVAGPAGWTLPHPIDQQAFQNDNAGITSVSCVTAAKCFAVDSVGDVLASATMNSWQTVTTDAQSNFVSISCASARFCAAVDNSGDVTVLTHGTWSDPVSIDPNNQLTSISCPTSAFCVAVDNAGDAFTFTGSVTDWAESTVDPNQDTIASVSCASTTFCAAVDQSGDAYTYDGTSWNTSGDVDNGNEFVQVSCFSAAFCAAVDNNGNATVLTNGNWSAGAMPQTAAGISCPALGYCVAVDTSGEALVYQQGAWSQASKIDGNNAFTAISCVRVDTCTAADQYDNVTYYAPSPAG